MKKIVALCLGLAACGGTKEETPKKNDVQEKCDVNGKKRCNGNAVETCTNEVWTVSATCTAEQVCEATSAYAAACVTDSEYDYEGFEPTELYFFYDDDYFGFHTIGLFESDDISLTIENWSDYSGHIGTSNSTVSLSGANSAYSTCGLCVFGTRNEKLFFAQSGSVTGRLGQEVGATGTLSFTDVVLVEVNESLTKVPNGETWVIDQVGFDEVESLRYPCAWDGLENVGDQVCVEDIGYASCEEVYPDELPGVGFLVPYFCEDNEICEGDEDLLIAECVPDDE